MVSAAGGQDVALSAALAPIFGLVDSRPAASAASASARAATAPAASRDARGNEAAVRHAPNVPGMVWIPGGAFVMGTDDPRSMAAERPAHGVVLEGYWIDATEVSNAQFARFVDATGYKTVAERPVNWEELKQQVPEGTPKPSDDMLQPGAMVFTPPSHAVPLSESSAWWRWVTGANWRHPEGPSSDIAGRENHPVVCVAWEDAAAYASWAGKRLPTEAEWECAARGGLAQQRFAWGVAEADDDRPQANIWQGQFPFDNQRRDKYERTAPVGSFSPNAYGVYDAAGNVWEWCADMYRADAYERQLAESKGRPLVNPTGPRDCWDPNVDVPATPARVIRGGSFLCHRSYCEAYRPSARRGLAIDTGMSHVGFRCAKSPPKP